jgi:O-antigen/teichoic acid export membrane protein
MLLTLGVRLYTSRLILQALGFEDFGIYNVVGGIVALFSVINGALSSGAMRFFSFELEGGNSETLRKTFSASFFIHVFIAGIVLLFTETIGLWYVNTHLVVPVDRLAATNWVYQFSIISSLLSLIQVPYNAIIISREKMNVYAWVSIAEVIFKLIFTYLLLNINSIDKLILYGLLNCIWSFLIQAYYYIYCKKNFFESKLVVVREKYLYKRMLSFSIWHLIGDFAFIGSLQAINLLINYYFGVVANAAAGIAYQVENAIALFSVHFMTAVKPQIVKLFAAGRIKKMMSLVFESSKYSFLLLYIISLPLFLEADFVLGIWFKDVPENVVLFLRCILLARLIVVFSHSISEACNAVGVVKLYWIGTGVTNLLIQVPLSYLFYKNGYPGETAFIIRCISFFICNLVQVIILKTMIEFSVIEYIKKVYFIGFLIAVLSLLPTMFIYKSIETGFLRLILVCLASIISVGVLTFFIGTNQENKKKILKILHLRKNL